MWEELSCLPFALCKMCGMLRSFRPRKLTGKPAFLTIADCEFKARRIQNTHTAVFSPLAAKSNAFRIHSEVIFLTGWRALRMTFSSSCESRKGVRDEQV